MCSIALKKFFYFVQMSKKWELLRYNLAVPGSNESLIVSGITVGLLTAGGITALTLGTRNKSNVVWNLGFILMLFSIAAWTWFGVSVFRRVKSKQLNKQ